jgi:c-di-GMP phosphodiesterase
MTDKNTSEIDQISVSLARQPVFDVKRRLWGYELFCVAGAGDVSSGLTDGGGVAVNLAESTYIGLQQILDRGKKIIVNFSEKGILDNLPYALPAALTVIKVTRSLPLGQSALDSLNTLKSDGYMIAVEWFSNQPGNGGFLDLADIICMDVSSLSKEDLAVEVDRARQNDVMLMADQVEDAALFDACLGLGFNLFRGHFFKAQEQISVRKMSAGEVSRFQIFRFIEQEDPDFDQLAKIIQDDVSISFRLLSYLNSAAFGFPQKVRSIRQAISLLGWRKIKNWLRVAVLTGMARNKTAADELIFLATQRGMFLETIGIEHDYWGFDPDTLHLLGMFSLLDAILGISMKEIVRYLPLEEKLKAALRRDPNNEYLTLLRLAECLEEAKWTEGERMIQQLSLDEGKVKAAFQKSVNWANELVLMQLSEAANKD